MTQRATMCGRKIAAIIVAAGYSSRMGRLKPLLPVGRIPILQRVIDLFKGVGIEDIVVVVGWCREELMTLIRKSGARPVSNEKFHRGMYSSVQTGVAALPDDVEGFFVLPVDIPLVRAQTLRLLVERFGNGSNSIVHPMFRGRRGHPPLIGARHIERIMAHPGTGGLKALLAKHECDACHVEAPDEYTLLAVNTPEAYAELIERFERYEIPTPGELEVLVTTTFRLSEDLLRHSRQVARAALRLAGDLNRSGHSLDTDLVFTAGILHDIAKGEPDHASVGGYLLRRFGFAAVADVVAAHTDFTVQPSAPVTEGEVVYLADKLVKGDRIVSLDARFEEAKRRCGSSPEAWRALRGRYKNAVSARGRIESALGRSLESVLGMGVKSTLDS